jgi:hypothetical protein
VSDAAVEIKKTGSLAAPRFFFFRMPPFMSKTSTTARTAKAVCKRLSKFYARWSHPFSFAVH